jgi:Rab family, other
LTKKETLLRVDLWLQEVKSVVTSENFQFIICGNKLDLSESRDVNTDDIKSISDKHQVKFFLVSAKTGENLETAYQYLVDKVYEDMENTAVRNYAKKKSLKVNGNSTIKLQRSSSKSNEKKNCC